MSSQNIISKDDKIFNALMDISPKLPIGVDMIYKILLSTVILLNVFVICSTLYYLLNQTNYLSIVTFINIKIIIFIFVFLSSCTSQTLNKYSGNSNSTQIKSNNFKPNKNKISKKKLENLSEGNNLGQSIVFEFRKERYLEGIQNNEVDDKINYAQKALQATFKMLSKAPTTGMEHLKIKNTSNKIKFDFKNFYDSISNSNKFNEDTNVLVLLPFSKKFRSIGEKIRKAIDLGVLQSKNNKIKFIYFNTGNDFNSEDIHLIIEKLNPRLIVGPLLRENLIKIKPVIDKFKIPVFSFTNDTSLSERGIWVLGFSPFDQINKIIKYASKCKKENIGFISVDNDYGRKIYNLVNNSEIVNSIKDKIFIDERMFKNKENLRKTISVFLNYNKTDNKDLISNDEYDFIILVGNRNFVLGLAPILTYYDVDLSKTELFATSVLNDKTLLNEHSLINAKFPFISETNVNEFNKLWSSVWLKTETDHLTRLGYYISIISIWVASQETNFENQIDEGKNKFSILGNKFTFKANGNVLRPINIYKIGKGGSIKQINSCL